MSRHATQHHERHALRAVRQSEAARRGVESRGSIYVERLIERCLADWLTIEPPDLISGLEARAVRWRVEIDAKDAVILARDV